MPKSNFENNYRKLIEKKNMFNEKTLIRMIKIIEKKLKYVVKNENEFVIIEFIIIELVIIDFIENQAAIIIAIHNFSAIDQLMNNLTKNDHHITNTIDINLFVDQFIDVMNIDAITTTTQSIVAIKITFDTNMMTSSKSN